MPGSDREGISKRLQLGLGPRGGKEVSPENIWGKHITGSGTAGTKALEQGVRWRSQMGRPAWLKQSDWDEWSL